VGGIGQTRNRLLCELPQDELAMLLQTAELVQIRPRQVLQHWRLPMEHVYFIERGLVSVSARVDDDFVEAWLVGSEGFVGAPLVLAEEQQITPHRRIVQIGGEAVRIPAREFLAVLPVLPVTRRLLKRYLQVVLFQASQFGACNAVHSVKQRLARWLLVAREGLDCDELPITQEVLSQLLGVRRATVSEAVETLQREEVIRASRGMISITDAEALRQVSCACHDLVRREYLRQIQSSFGSKGGTPDYRASGSASR
jgi:CRP-like cAMP-binding protein